MQLMVDPKFFTLGTILRPLEVAPGARFCSFFSGALRQAPLRGWHPNAQKDDVVIWE